MSNRFLSIHWIQKMKMRRAALAFGLLAGSALLAGQGCVATVEAPEDEVAPAVDDLVVQPAVAGRRELMRVAQDISLPSPAQIEQIPVVVVRNAARKLYIELSGFKRNRFAGVTRLRYSANRVNAAGRNLESVVRQVARGRRLSMNLPEAADPPDDTGEGALALTTSLAAYELCLDTNLTGYTFCLNAAGGNAALQAQCNANFLNLVVACSAVF